MTETHEWRFVPGKINPVDAANWSQLKVEAIPYSWLDGPEFLYHPEELWSKDLPWMAVKEERRSARSHSVKDQTSFDWEMVSVSPDEIPALVQLQSKYLDLLKRNKQEVYGEEINKLRKGKQLSSLGS